MSIHNTLQLVNNRLMHAHHGNTFPAMYAAEFGNVLNSECINYWEHHLF